MTYIYGKWRQEVHLEPPHGWLNDPNGLSFFGGYYHVYFHFFPLLGIIMRMYFHLI